MISSGNESKGFPSAFLPHQIAFLETALDPTSKKMILLRADVGLEKVSTYVTLVSQLLRERPEARLLFVVDPTVLRSEVEYRLSEANIRTLFFDVYHFREMFDSTTREIVWPSRIAVVVSIDFAKQPDTWDSLAATHWDLVIVDEVYLDSARAKAVQKIAGSADRVVLAPELITELPQAFPMDDFPMEDITLVEWRRSQIVDHDGKPLEPVPPILHEIHYTLTEEELGLREAVNDLCGELNGIYDDELINRLESSPAALESTLDTVVWCATDLLEEDEKGSGSSESEYEPEPAFNVNGATFAAELAESVLKDSSDSKLGVFDILLDHLSGSQPQQKKICVCTEFIETLYYLSAEIEGRGISSQLLHSKTGAADRHQSLNMFSEGQKILVATTDAMEGVNLQKVTDLILYDFFIPADTTMLQRLLSRFERFGGRSQLHIYVFVPSNSSNGLIAESIAVLRGFLADQSRPASESLK
jgi:hypothetical protein